jgi:hypothetical protein
MLKPSAEKEIYLFKTVPVGPTDVTIPTGLESYIEKESGVFIGLPEAADANLSQGVQLVTSGDVYINERQKISDGDSELLITVKSFGKLRNQTQSDKFKQTNRFNITYAGDDYPSKINTAWQSKGELSASTGFAPAETYRFQTGNCWIVEDSLQRQYLFALGNVTSTSDYRILCYRFSALDGNTQFTPFGYSSRLISGAGIKKLNAPMFLSACMADDLPVIALTTYGDNAAEPHYGAIYIFTMDIADGVENPRITLKTSDIALGSNTDQQRFDGGISIEYTGKRFVIAAGSREDSILTPDRIERSIVLASSVDLVDWSPIGSNANAFGIVASTDKVNTTEYITAMDRLEDESRKVICAVTQRGGILISYDNGGTWSTPTNNFAARNGMALNAVKIIKNEGEGSFIIYVGGEWSLIMRSVDEGKTFYVVSAPLDSNFSYDQKTGTILSPPVTQTGTKYQVAVEDFQTGADGSIPTPFIVPGIGVPTKNFWGPYLRYNIVEIISQRSTSTGSETAWNLWFITNDGMVLLNRGEQITALERDSTGSFTQIFELYDGGSSIMGACLLKNDPAAPSILLCGTFPNEETPTGNFNKRSTNKYALEDGWSGSNFLRIENALNPVVNIEAKNAGNGWNFSTDEKSIQGVRKVVRVSDTSAYGIGNGGSFLVKWEANQTDTHIVSMPPRPEPPSTRDISTIVRRWNDRTADGSGSKLTNFSLAGLVIGSQPEAPESITNILVLDAAGNAFISADYGQSFQKHIMLTSSGRGTSTGCGISLAGETFLIGNLEGIWIFNSTDRTFPFLKFSKITGNLYMSCSNLSTGQVEIWGGDESEGGSYTISLTRLLPSATDKRTRPRRLYSDIYENAGIMIGFNATNNDLTYVPTGVPRSSIVETNEPALYLLTDNAARVSYDNFNSLELTTEGNVPIPMQVPQTPNDVASSWVKPSFMFFSVMNSSRIYGAVFSTDVNAKLGLTTNRDWTLASGNDPSWEASWLVDPPISLNKQWIGLGTLSLKWLGVPYTGDKFNIKLSYQFPKEHIAIDSPLIYWKARRIESVSGNFPIHLFYRRDDPDVVEAIGDGEVWNVDSAALFGTNFPYARWAISVPTYKGNSFPTDQADYTEFTMTAVVDQGTFVRATSLSGNTAPNKSIIIDPSKKWEINQFASGIRDWYIILATTTDGIAAPDSSYIRRIISNTQDTIIYEGASPMTVAIDASTPLEYAIFSDRMFNDGSAGTRTSAYGNPEPGLYGTEYQFGQWLRITIPVFYNSIEDCVKIGTAIFGRQNPITIMRQEGYSRRHKYTRGYRWTLTPFNHSETTPTGITTIKKLGRPVQKFSLQWNQIEDWEINVFYNLLMPDVNQPFVILFDSTDSISAELVQLRDEIEVQHESGTLFSHGVVLYEIK